MPVALTAEHLAQIRSAFPPADQADVERLLIDECGTNLPFLAENRESDIQRIRTAVLKLSAGNAEKFLYWLEVAKQDWRDVLVGN